MVLKSTSIVTFIVLFSISGVCSRKLPSYIDLCHQSDPNINACFKKAVEQVRPHLKRGIPEMQIPSMDPLIVPEAGLETGGFKASFKNIEIYYADEFVLEDLNVDLKHNIVELGMSFPRLRIKSVYNVDGRILILQLNGQGPADGNFTNVAGKVTASGSRYMKKGKEYIKFDQSNLNLNLGKPTFKFDNLFRDNKELNDQTNKILNENILDIIDELRPVIDQTVHGVIHGIIDRIFARFSFDELFPK